MCCALRWEIQGERGNGCAVRWPRPASLCHPRHLSQQMSCLPQNLLRQWLSVLPSLFLTLRSLQQHRILQSTADEPGKTTGCGLAKGKVSSPRARSREAAVLPAKGMQLPEIDVFRALMAEAVGQTLRSVAEVWEKLSFPAPRTQTSPVSGKAHP